MNFLWLVDPLLKTLEVLKREGPYWLQIGLCSDADLVKMEPFEELEIDLTSWWID